VVRSEHGTEDRDDRVEGRVGERNLLGVGLTQVESEPFGSRALATALEQGGHVVDAGDDGADACGGERCVAASGGDVEHGRAGTQIGLVDQALGDRHDQGRDLGEVAARPGRLLARLHRCQVESRWGGHRTALLR
jgi:hypothetical protein